PPPATPDLPTGASPATPSAVVAPRHTHLGDDHRHGTLYVTEHTHHSVAKAARIAGLPTTSIRIVPSDNHLRMDPDAAAHLITTDRAQGRHPFPLAATAGTTRPGTLAPPPPPPAPAPHLTTRGPTSLTGIEPADPIAFDPHKRLSLPYGTGVLLVRDPRHLHAAHAADADYLQDIDRLGDLPDFGNLGIELTRDYRGLRLWLPLQIGRAHV